MKASADQAGYQGADQAPFQCAACGHFDGQGACELVDGVIEPEGCCNLFSKGGSALVKQAAMAIGNKSGNIGDSSKQQMLSGMVKGPQ